MYRTSRRVEYGLLALKWMHQKKDKELTTAREMSKRFGISFDVLARTLQLLQKAGVLIAEQGVQGGYRIGTNLADISFDTFSHMIVGETSFVGCLDDAQCCPAFDKCNIVSPMAVLNDKLHRFLSSFTVLDVIEWKRLSLSQKKESVL